MWNKTMFYSKIKRNKNRIKKNKNKWGKVDLFLKGPLYGQLRSLLKKIYFSDRHHLYFVCCKIVNILFRLRVNKSSKFSNTITDLVSV